MTKDDAVPVTAELLPCPFCGSRPHQGPGKKQSCQLHGEPFQRYHIRCPNGHAQVDCMNRDAAITAWNQRHRGSTAVVDVLWVAKHFLAAHDLSAADPDSAELESRELDAISDLRAALASLSQTPATPILADLVVQLSAIRTVLREAHFALDDSEDLSHLDEPVHAVPLDNVMRLHRALKACERFAPKDEGWDGPGPLVTQIIEQLGYFIPTPATPMVQEGLGETQP